jgi:hypothetical protein
MIGFILASLVFGGLMLLVGIQVGEYKGHLEAKRILTDVTQEIREKSDPSYGLKRVDR